MSSLRIAYVINSLEGGGAALPVPDVIAEMRKQGAQVRLFALSRRDGRAAAALDAAAIDYLVSPAGKADHIKAARWLWRELRAFQPMIIWTSLTQATVLGEIIGTLLRVPVVSWQHNAFLKPANERLLKWTGKLTKLWIADSASVARLTARRLNIDPASILVWPLFRADLDAPVAQACPPNARFRIGSLGRLHPNKGYDVLIDALAILETRHKKLSGRFEVVIGGAGDGHAQLATRASAKNISNLVFAGYQADPGQFLASLHGYVQPSRAEGLCIAAHEAMQAGLATIVSNVGEMAVTMRVGETGFVVPPQDTYALADAIAMLVSDFDRAHAMGRAARDHVLDLFSSERFSDAAQDVFRRLNFSVAKNQLPVSSRSLQTERHERGRSQRP
jgi:glycosyltransferase involved in cell wall biosynthesis